MVTSKPKVPKVTVTMRPVKTLLRPSLSFRLPCALSSLWQPSEEYKIYLECDKKGVTNSELTT